MEKKLLHKRPEASSRRVNDDFFAEGRSYYLTDAEGRIIVPGTWEDVVRPGDKITFHFNGRNQLKYALERLRDRWWYL